MSKQEYTLYELVPKEQGAQDETNLSPYVFKTICDLAILGITVEHQKLTFLGIRGALASETGNKDVTVPTLQVKSGEYVTDSFSIAEWLDAHHGSPEHGLFRNHEGHAFARFLNIWSDTVLAPAMKNLFRPLFYTMQDKASQEYFARVKCGGIDNVYRDLDILGDQPQVDLIAAETRTVLQLLETYLQKSGGPFILGTKPSHADSAIWGWYASSQVNPGVVNPLIWENSGLPRIAAWVKAVNQLVGFKFDFNVPKLK